jgi:hypothetical protein
VSNLCAASPHQFWTMLRCRAVLKMTPTVGSSAQVNAGFGVIDARSQRETVGIASREGFGLVREVPRSAREMIKMRSSSTAKIYDARAGAQGGVTYPDFQHRPDSQW